MKRTLIVALITFVSIASFGQADNYKAFKLDIGGLYAIPTDDAFNAGGGFYLEPKFNITDNFTAGFRLEWAQLLLVEFDEIAVALIGSYELTCDYYYGDNYVRPFGGLGFGSFSMAAISADEDEGSIELGTKFGFTPRIGVLVGHFRLALAYNVITGVEGPIGANYMALKFGWEIGGGKK